MRSAPWVKRIELQTGECTSLPLDASKPFITSIHETDAFNDSFKFDGQSWYHVTQREGRWAIHGTTASSGSALYTFMEFPEARHAELETSLSGDPSALSVYADWLEEQGDPYAASLKPTLLKERGPAGRWFLEGLDRSGKLEFTLREALVRAVKVDVEAAQLPATLHRLVHLRACVALEKLAITQRALGQSPATMWRNLRWPSSMTTLVLPSATAATREAVGKTVQVKVARK